MSTIPPNAEQNAPVPVPPPGVPPTVPTPPEEKSKLGLIALIVAVIGFIFGIVPGALVIGWILLPIAFILSLVALFQKGKKTKAIVALIISIVGFIASGIAFLLVVDQAVTGVLDELSSETEIVQQDDAAGDTAESADQLTELEEIEEEEQEEVEEPAAAVGSRDNPAALGDQVVSDNWTVTVNSVDLDATAEVLEASVVNSEPEEGNQFMLANLTATYTGEDKGNTLEISVAFVSSGGEVYKSSDSFAVAPDPQFLMDELYTDASDTGNVAIEIPADAEGLLRVTPGIFADEVFIAVN